MSNLNRWGELYEIYRKTRRESILKSLYENKPFSESWSYWLALFIYIAVSVISYCFFGGGAFLSIVLTAIIIYIWLEFKIANKYKAYYKTHNLKEHPFFLRTKYLTYILFSEELSNRKNITLNDVDGLVDWDDIRKHKLNTFDILKEPSTLLLFTVFSGMFIEYLKIEKLINTQVLLLFFVIIVFIVWSVWAISDMLKSQKKQDLEIRRFLKWWKLDNEKNITRAINADNSLRVFFALKKD